RGRVLGLESAGRAQPLADRLGLRDAQWTAARPAGSVPALRFADLASGSVPTSAVAHRLAIVGIDEARWGGADQNGDGSNLHQIAAGLGAALDDGPRRSAPRWSALLLVLLFGSLLGWAHSRRGMPWALAVLGAAPLLTLAGGGLHAALGGAWLLPIASVTG